MKQYSWSLRECLFIQQLFLLFLRTIILFWCSKVHRVMLILPTKYLRLSGLWSQHADLVILRKKNGSSCIFTSLGILPIPKIFITVIRELQALEVLNFPSSGFLKVLQYTESPSYLQIWPVIKVWSWYYSIRQGSLFPVFGLFDPYVLFYWPRVIRISR